MELLFEKLIFYLFQMPLLVSYVNTAIFIIITFIDKD